MMNFNSRTTFTIDNDLILKCVTKKKFEKEVKNMQHELLRDFHEKVKTRVTTDTKIKPILIDCDDVCIDLLGAWLDSINKRYNLNYKPSDIKTWNIARWIPELTSDQLFSILHEESFYSTINSLGEAKKYLAMLKNERYPIKIVTAHDYHSIKFKMERFFELFPFFKWEDIIVSKDKSIIDGSVMIDDNFDNLISNYLVEMKILFKQYHNTAHHNDKDIDHTTCSWHDIYRFIKYHYPKEVEYES